MSLIFSRRINLPVKMDDLNTHYYYEILISNQYAEAFGRRLKMVAYRCERNQVQYLGFGLRPISLGDPDLYVQCCSKIIPYDENQKQYHKKEFFYTFTQPHFLNHLSPSQFHDNWVSLSEIMDPKKGYLSPQGTILLQTEIIKIENMSALWEKGIISRLKYYIRLLQPSSSIHQRLYIVLLLLFALLIINVLIMQYNYKSGSPNKPSLT